MSLALIYVTCPDAAVARRLANELLARKLIACANIVAIESVYRYRAQVVDEPETLLLMKTRDDLKSRVIEETVALHPYETPCVVAYEATGANQAYIDWVRSETLANP